MSTAADRRALSRLTRIAGVVASCPSRLADVERRAQIGRPAGVAVSRLALFRTDLERV